MQIYSNLIKSDDDSNKMFYDKKWKVFKFLVYLRVATYLVMIIFIYRHMVKK